MKNRIKNRFVDKREGLVYVVVAAWIVMGLLATHFNRNLEHVACFYLSLTATVASFIFGESKRASSHSSIFFKGKSSNREIMVYITILLWLILGFWGIVNNSDLLSITAYFSSLSPFISAFIIGETFRPLDPTILRPQLASEQNTLINSSSDNSGGDSIDSSNSSLSEMEGNDPHKNNPDLQDLLDKKLKEVY